MINVGNIRAMDINDVNAVVKVHLSSFQGFFLTFLGRQFLSELYAGIVADYTGIAFVYREESCVLGFVAGTSQPAGFYSHLLHRRWWRFALASLIPILKNPLIIPRLLRAFSRNHAEDVHENCATLMSIAIAPEAQGRGMGQALVQVFLQESARRDVKQVNLTTDALDNEAANRFYQKLGFTLQQVFTTPEGREMNEYTTGLQVYTPHE